MELVPGQVRSGPCRRCWSVGASQVSVTDRSVTWSDAVPEMLPDMALIVLEPAAMPVARPFEPAALLMVATAVFDELQVTAAVRFWVELSE